ncbi:hypothetical protein L6164_017059 [Bauhinia variegata]|uniref:Uncharacterized protein n=1 Tax=Bauhinia variegata TaxID=167791 RepID=A0ACB9N6M6_BAUVA|nr:hypothetical protein L6164_017059 [Bauhinia variegata]
MVPRTAAVLYTGKPRTPEVVVDETWFSHPDICRELEVWYVLAKTLAEDAAWKFAKENNIDMVALNPALVVGPLLQPTLNTSAAAVLNLINGAQTFINFSVGWINVKDVACAHVQAFEIPSASGRYCLAERVVHYSEIVEILHELYPSLQLPERYFLDEEFLGFMSGQIRECVHDKPFMPTYQISKEKAKSLGIEFTPLDVTLKETVESLREKKFIDSKQFLLRTTPSWC